VLIKSCALGLFLALTTLVPLGIKWEIDKKITLFAAVSVGIVSGVCAGVLASFLNLSFVLILIVQILMVLSLSSSLLLWRFFRDPERKPPQDRNTILSPADGQIIYIKKIQAGEIPLSEKKGRIIPLHDFFQSNLLAETGTLIGISMNFLDVHINRAPLDGKIDLLKHIKGLFLSLKKREAVVLNERVLTIIDNGRFKIGIVQIASRLVRKIVPCVREGQEVRKGQRIGMIRFGSQVDLYLPDVPSLHITVGRNSKVKAGLSVIATVE
jgi:phosphatidylserine decarboxylase